MFDKVGDYHKPALIASDAGWSTKSFGEAVSHEAGHNLGLLHDGQPGVEYYPGSGSSETGWAPIMGNGYSRNLTQWSKGEYPGANNQQDDIAIIARYVGYREDEAGGNAASALALPVSAKLSRAGIITDPQDSDVYRLAVGAGPVAIDIKSASTYPNLDVFADLADASGNVVVTSNPATLLSARIAATVPRGIYYLRIRGTGKGSPLNTGGYSDYGSLGPYVISRHCPAHPASGDGPFREPICCAEQVGVERCDHHAVGGKLGRSRRLDRV